MVQEICCLNPALGECYAVHILLCVNSAVVLDQLLSMLSMGVVWSVIAVRRCFVA